MSSRWILALSCSLALATSLSADWSEARERALKVAASEEGFKADVEVLLDADSPVAIKTFVEKHESARKTDVARVLVELLHHKTPVFRMAAVGWLNKLGDPSVLPDMVEAIKTADPTVKNMAVTFIGRFAGDEAAELLQPLLNDDDVQVRRSALQALAAVRNPALAPVIAPCLTDRDKTLRQRAGQSLSILLQLESWVSGNGAPDTSGTPHATLSEAQRKEIEAKARSLRAPLTPLVEAFYEAPGRQSALHLIQGARDDLESLNGVFLVMLHDDRTEILLPALHALERLGDPAAAEGVVALFVKDGRAEVKAAAARTLKRMLSYASR